MSARAVRWLLPLALGIAVLGLWGFLVRAYEVPRFVLPPPSANPKLGWRVMDAAGVAEKFGVPIAGKPKLFTVRGRCHPKDGGIHTDSTTKIITVLLYLNPAWEADGGRLRVLRSATDLNDFAAEVPPLAGTLLAFKRSERSFHGHESFAGERRAIQLNWITDVATRNREEARHRWSARLKQLNPFG